MLTKEIKSLQHPIVKHLVKLQKERRYREEKRSLLIEGKKMIFEFQGEIEMILCTSAHSIPSHLSPRMRFVVPFEIIKKIATTKAPEPLLALVSYPDFQDLKGKSKILVLDRISDPGNLGALLRTALAFGFDGAFLIDCADPFSPKALRSAKGTTFHLPLQAGSEKELKLLIQENGLTPYIADASGEDGEFALPLALILGSESKGPSETLKALGKLISIPMDAVSESLNVAVAGGILMHKVKEISCPSLTTT